MNLRKFCIKQMSRWSAFFLLAVCFLFYCAIIASCINSRHEKKIVKFASSNEKAVTIYVSPEGNDDFSGRSANVNADNLNGPVRGCQAALQQIRRIRTEEKSMSIHGRIVFCKGVYPIDEVITLGPQDSFLSIEGDTSGNTILCGGRRITGWKKEGDRFWVASLREVREGKRDFRQLYVNGEVRPRARLPAQGLFEHESIFNSRWISANGGGFIPPPTIEDRTKMIYGINQLGTGFSLKNAEFIIYHIWDVSWAKAIAHDPLTRTLHLDPPCTYPPGTFGIKLYAVENVREGMLKAGQWYLDRDEGKVVYWPLPGEDPNISIVEAPFLMTMLRIEGTKDQPIRDLTLRNIGVDLTGVTINPSGWGAGTLDGAVSIKFAENCRLIGLTISRAGGQGIKIIDSSDTTVENSEIHHTGANGIFLHKGQRNLILNNLIHHVGMIYPNAIGINASHLKLSRIAHNEVFATPYCGISLGNAKDDMDPSENVLEYNRVWDVMNALDDGGCIYLYGKERFTQVRGNVLSEAHGRTGLAMGLYLDESVEDVTCEKNVVYKTPFRTLHVHHTKRCKILNNIFVGDPNIKVCFSRSADCIFERNVLYAPDGTVILENPEGVRFHNSLYFAKNKQILNRPPYNEGFLLENPLFIDPDNANYHFQNESQVSRIGFEAFNHFRAGRVSQAEKDLW